MFHMCALTTNFAAAATDGDLNAVTDQHLTVSASNKFILPYPADILAAVALGATLSRARIVAPSLRSVNFPNIRPIIVGAAIPTRPPVSEFMQSHTPRVRLNEELNIQVTNGAIERGTGFLWLQKQYQPPPPGPVYSARFTAAITGSAFQWDSGSITQVDTLPSGRYSVIGMSCHGANLMAARLIFPEGGPRPGVLANVQAADTDENRWRDGRYGEFGQFEQTALPLLELFKSAAGVTQELTLDLVKLS